MGVPRAYFVSRPCFPRTGLITWRGAVAPTAMIFVPCKDGISHNEIEDARPEHLEAGANVLLAAMLAQAQG